MKRILKKIPRKRTIANMGKLICGDANPKGNIALHYKGACKKELKIEDAYRCTGCGGWFHKDCIMEHFKLEEKHDWGRQEEIKKIIKIAKSLKTDERKVANFGEWQAETYNDKMLVNAVLEKLIKIYKS